MGYFPSSGGGGGGGGTISDITSTGGTISVTGGTGPTTNVEVANVLDIISGSGNPNTNSVAGTLNQLYQNTAATGDNDWLWRCSVAGTPGTWVGKI